MPEFKIGDKVRRVSPSEDHAFWDEPEDGLFHGNVYTVSGIGAEGAIRLEGCNYAYSAKYFELAETINTTQSETYTPSELCYISELEDRVEYLEALCSDYANIVDEKDFIIKMLQYWSC